MKPSDLSFLRCTIGRFYNIHNDYNIVDAFRNSFFNSDDLNFNDDEQDGNILISTDLLLIMYQKLKLKNIKNQNLKM
jgi:hypothetical protein